MSNGIFHKTSTRLDLNVVFFILCIRIIIYSFYTSRITVHIVHSAVRCQMYNVVCLENHNFTRNSIYLLFNLNNFVMFLDAYEIFTGFFFRKKRDFSHFPKSFFALVKHAIRPRCERLIHLARYENRKVNVHEQNRYRAEKAGQTPCIGQRLGFIPMRFFYYQTEFV